MAARLAAVLLLLSGPVPPGLPAGAAAHNSDRGWLELRRVQNLATQSRYGDCWARALEHLDTRCSDMTSETQGRLALSFTRCHLSGSGRDFPSCPEGSEVSRCTAEMDSVAFNAYTEFFTHTHSLCHFLQSDAWQSRAHHAMHRLTETSADVAQQLQSTRQMAADLLESQSAALQAQQEILDSGEELKITLQDSTQGLRSAFSELGSASREQQVALSELFNRVSFLQSFLMMEAHALSSCLYNAAALGAAFLLTSTQRSSRARLVLLALVCVNFYLERKIYQFVSSSAHPEHTHMELVCVYVGVLRRVTVCVGVCVLLLVCVRYTDPLQQSLLVLQQLRETQRGLQEALQRVGEQQAAGRRSSASRHRQEVLQRRRQRARREEEEEEEEEDGRSFLPVSPPTATSHIGGLLSSSVQAFAADVTHNASAGPGRPARPPRPRGSSPCPSPSSPLVYSVLVEDGQRYSLRSRRSQNH